MPKLLITGISGAQGRLLAKRVCRSWQVIGVDREPWPSAPDGVVVHQFDLIKRRFEDIFRTERPDAVVHGAFIRHFRSDPATRHEINVAGTKRMLEHCAEYGVKQVIVLSSSYVYGALPTNPRYMDEDHPLNASRNFPEIRDLCEVEGLVGAFLWRYPEIATCVLRPANTLGAGVHSAIGTYLKLPAVPTIMGFNPMMQFIHAEDVAEATEIVLHKKIRGVYNVAGPGAVPIKRAIREIGRARISIPDPIAHLLIGTLFNLSVYQFPPGAIDYIKYPCTISDARFRSATGFRPRHSLAEIFASVSA
ncbi:MAG TPA: NAD-dependent epimerase/dehydratase family protein [Candidatus Limnocylindrales bacterium]|nr:NAD-dependent epimerase/dehydratase family protein [Candidatus Limnocylindrales bacterium]